MLIRRFIEWEIAIAKLTTTLILLMAVAILVLIPFGRYFYDLPKGNPGELVLLLIRGWFGFFLVGSMFNTLCVAGQSLINWGRKRT